MIDNTDVFDSIEFRADDNKSLKVQTDDNLSGTFVAYTQEDLLSGSNYTSSEYTGNQVSRSIDFLSISSDLSKTIRFGSAYAHVSNSINEITSTYPLGAMIGSASTIGSGSSGTVLTLTSTTMMHCTGRELLFSSINFDDYCVSINSYSGSSFSLVESTTLSDTNSMVSYELNDSWGLYNEYVINGSNHSIVIFPTDLVYAEYLAKRTKYAQELLNKNRDNSWPRDDAGRNIEVYSSDYQLFVSDELAIASDSDSISGNTLWKSFIPFSFENLDSSDSSLYKLILTYGHSFDIIKNYIDSVSNLHSANYSDDNSINREYIERLASLWGWSLSSKVALGPFKDSLLKVLDWPEYSTSISLDDFSYNVWKKILISLVSIYKAKGTDEAIKMLLAVYGIPSELLGVELKYERIDSTGNRIQDSTQGGVFIRNSSGSTITFYNKDGTSQTISGRLSKNLKTVSVEISPARAIEMDVLDYYNDTYSTSYRLNDLESVFMNLYCPSDGSAQYLSEYVGLNEVYKEYLILSTNRLTTSMLQPFVDFLDINVDDIVRELLPASCRVDSIGSVVRNTIFNRNKHAWVDYSTPTQPFNSGTTFDIFVPSFSKQDKYRFNFDDVISSVVSSQRKLSTSIDCSNFGQLKVNKNLNSRLDYISALAKSEYKFNTSVFSYTVSGEPQFPIGGDEYQVVSDLSASTAFSFDLPIVNCLTQYSGTTNVLNYDEFALVVSNDNKMYLDIIVDGLSRSGQSLLNFELFKKLEQSEIDLIKSTKYYLSSIISEIDSTGVYELSTTTGLSIGDFITVKSDLDYFYADESKIIDVDYDSNRISIFPKFGLCGLPIGGNGNIVNLRDYVDDEFVKTILRYISIGTKLSDVETLMYFEYGIKIDNPIVLKIIDLIYYLENQNLNISSIEDITYSYIKSIGPIIISKIPYSFDWYSPIQTIEISPTNWGSFIYYDTDSSSAHTWVSGLSSYITSGSNGYSSANTLAVSGLVEFGGLTTLNSNILVDKNEYFWTYNIKTSVSSQYSGYSGVLQTIGSNVVCEKNSPYFDMNNIRYYGSYFTYMTKPKSPVLEEYPLYESQTGSTITIPQTDTASVYISFKGVSDSDKLDVDFIKAPTNTYNSTTAYTNAYSGITSNDWAYSGITIQIPVKLNASDNTIYTIQTTLDPISHYWYRIKNYKSNVNMFGVNLSVFNTTEPKIFKTGEFTDEIRVDGEIEEEPTAPVPNNYDVGNLEAI